MVRDWRGKGGVEGNGTDSRQVESENNKAAQAGGMATMRRDRRREKAECAQVGLERLCLFASTEGKMRRKKSRGNE
jgi:hypothetical protein